MNLLIVTQRVDCRDPILGFFCGWIAEFAKRCEKVTVITQEVGACDLPSNVTVLSLGKERRRSRIAQVLRFWVLLWKHRAEYEAVFVHMVPIWVVLGCDSWILLRKRIYLWYEARGKRWPLHLAHLVVRKVFSASAAGMPLRSRKSVITGHGIDTGRFFPIEVEREPGLLVTVGRITRSKRLDVLLRCLMKLPSSFHLTIGGALRTNEDFVVLEHLKSHIAELGLKDRVTMAEISPEDVPLLLARAEAFLHSSETSLDKSLLEAMAAGCLCVSSSIAARSVLPPECRTTDETMAETLGGLFALPPDRQDVLRRELRRRVVEGHALPRLIERLVGEMASE